MAAILAALAAGPLIDRLGAVRLVPYMLTPLTFAMLVVAVFDNPWAVWPYFLLAGIQGGISHTAVSAMWAEVYGTQGLARIGDAGPSASGGVTDSRWHPTRARSQSPTSGETHVRQAPDPRHPRPRRVL